MDQENNNNNHRHGAKQDASSDMPAVQSVNTHASRDPDAPNRTAPLHVSMHIRRDKSQSQAVAALVAVPTTGTIGAATVSHELVKGPLFVE